MTNLLVVMDQMYGNGRGGTERQVLRLLPALREHGIAPRVLFLRKDPWHANARFDFPWKEIGVGSLLPQGLIRASRCVCTELDRSNTSVLLSFFDDAMLVAAAARATRGSIRFIATQRNMGSERSLLTGFAIDMALRAADSIVVNSQAIRASLAKRSRGLSSRLVVVENIPQETAGSFGTVAPVVRNAVAVLRGEGLLVGVIVANLRPVKGVQDALHALAVEPARSVHLGLVICGDGPQRAELEALALRLGLERRVVFVGNIENASANLELFDFGVLPSHAEGSANVGLEFARAGLPFVATDVGGNSDLLRESQAGLPAAPRDPAALSFAIAKLLRDPVRCAELASRGVAYSSRLRPASEVVAEYAAVIQNLSCDAVR